MLLHLVYFPEQNKNYEGITQRDETFRCTEMKRWINQANAASGFSFLGFVLVQTRNELERGE